MLGYENPKETPADEHQAKAYSHVVRLVRKTCL